MGNSGKNKHIYFSVSFWDDEWVCSLKPLEKMLYLYLLTNPLTNIAGVYKITERRIVFDTGLTQKQVQDFIGKFQEDHKAYRMGEYVVIPSAPKHQQWETSDKIYKGIVNYLEEIGPENLRQLVRMNYKFDLKVVFDRLKIPYGAVSIPHEEVSNTSSEKSPIEMVLEESAAVGFFIEADIAARLVGSIDPAWIMIPHTFMEMAAERARGGRYADLPGNEQKAIYISALLKWDDLRQEYPKWRAALEAKDKKEQEAHDEEDRRRQRQIVRDEKRPSMCQCGAELDNLLRCLSCGGDYEFNETTWEYDFFPKGSRPDLLESFKKLRGLR
jgi:hypothetical protein